MNRRGGVPVWIWLILAFFVVTLGATIIGYDFSSFLNEKGSISLINEIGKTIGFETAFNLPGAIWFNYIFGQIPFLLADYTNNISAGIIVIGLWFLLFLTFGEVLGLFSFFNQITSWIGGALLAIIAANIKLISLISVFLLAVTSFLGALSIFASIILAFVAFFGVNLGLGKFKEWANERRKAVLRMQASMGSEKAKAGLQVMGDVGDRAVRIGR